MSSLRRPGRFFFSALILAIFVLKSFIPAGFMPQMGPVQIAMVICTGSGPATVYVPADKAPFEHAPAAKAHGADVCAFANVLAAGFTPNADIALPDFASASQPAVHESLYLPSVSFSAYVPRGPPAFLLQTA